MLGNLLISKNGEYAAMLSCKQRGSHGITLKFEEERGTQARKENLLICTLSGTAL